MQQHLRVRNSINVLFVLLATPAFASIIGSYENRMTYAEFAKSKFGNNTKTLSDYSAAGKFWCVDSWESGALVRRNDILVIAAHSVMEPNKKGICARRPNLAKCYYQSIRSDGSFGRAVKIDPNTIKVSKNYRCRGEEFDNDWAVVQLSTSYDEITPFAPMESRNLKIDGKILAFSAQSDNFRRPHTPTICEGKFGYLWKLHSGPTPTDSYGFGIDCSAGPGNSGGAVVMRVGDSIQYIGLLSLAAGPEFDRHPFDNSNFSGGPLLHDEFRDAVDGM